MVMLVSHSANGPVFCHSVYCDTCDSHFYLRQGGYVFVVVCLCVCVSVCWQLYTKASKWICMKFSGKVGSGPVNVIKFWWQSRSPSGYRDCFLDSSLLRDTESG